MVWGFCIWEIGDHMLGKWGGLRSRKLILCLLLGLYLNFKLLIALPKKLIISQIHSHYWDAKSFVKKLP